MKDLPEPEAPLPVDRQPLLGTELIARERNRQISQEKWSARHDDQHTDQSLAIVAALYAVAGIPDVMVIDTNTAEESNEDAWPASWASGYDKRDEHPRLRQLAIAGALIAAEIDRLQRAGIEDEKRERAENAARVRQSHSGL